MIVPLLDEEDNIFPLHEELSGQLAGHGSHEIIYVDDGSVDSTFEKLTKLAEHGPIKVIRLRRNFGQTAAIAAGISHAQGDVIVLMDGDRQNDPADIRRLLEKIEEGADVVSGWRKDRKDAYISRRLPSQLANALISAVTGVKLHDYGCTLKAYRREVLSNIELYGEMHRFIPALASWVGASVDEIVVNHRPRVAGRSKYGIGRTLKVVLDLLTVKFLSSFSTKPIYVFGGAGFLAGSLAIVAAGVAAYEKFVSGIFVHRNPLFTISIFLGVLAAQFLFMGLIAELVTRTYHESQGKAIYVIRETKNIPASTNRA